MYNIRELLEPDGIFYIQSEYTVECDCYTKNASETERFIKGVTSCGFEFIGEKYMTMGVRTLPRLVFKKI
jgi:hypothetical protein